MANRPIPFTQFMRPNGRAVEVSIERPAGIAAKAEALIAKGYHFECEVLTTCEISLTIANDDGDLDIEVVSNGPDVPLGVDRLIERNSAAFAEA